LSQNYGAAWRQIADYEEKEAELEKRNYCCAGFNLRGRPERRGW